MSRLLQTLFPRMLRGSTHGVVVRVLEDGRLVWRTEAGSELIALPETLTRAED